MNGRSGLGWLMPLAGVGFVVLGIVSFIVQGEPKSADDPVNEIVDFYLDNKDSIIAGQAIGLISGLLLIAFGAYLAKVLRAADQSMWVLPLLPLLGFVIMDVGFAIDGTIMIALSETADDIEPSSVQTLQALWATTSCRSPWGSWCSSSRSASRCSEAGHCRSGSAGSRS